MESAHIYSTIYQKYVNSKNAEDMKYHEFALDSESYGFDQSKKNMTKRNVLIYGSYTMNRSNTYCLLNVSKIRIF